jgi:hypothetical protein
VGVALVFMLAALVVVVRWGGTSRGQWQAEGPVPTVAFGAVIAAPGLVALIGRRRKRPVMFAAAALACVPLAPLSIVTLPIWIPAVLFMVAWVYAGTAQPTAISAGRSAIGIGVCLALIAAAAGLLVFGTMPYTYTYATGGESGSYVTASHGLASLVLVALSVVVTSWTAGPGVTRPTSGALGLSGAPGSAGSG